jgi:hypothetical protein
MEEEKCLTRFLERKQERNSGTENPYIYLEAWRLDPSNPAATGRCIKVSRGRDMALSFAALAVEVCSKSRLMD